MHKNTWWAAIVIVLLMIVGMSTVVSAIDYDDEIFIVITGSAGDSTYSAKVMNVNEVYDEEFLGVLTLEQAETFDDLFAFVTNIKVRYSQASRNSGTLKVIESIENGVTSDTYSETFYFDCSSFVSTLCYELYGFDCNIYKCGNAYTTSYFYGDRTNFDAKVYTTSCIDPSTLKKGQLLLGMSDAYENHIMFCCGDSMILHCNGNGIVYEKLGAGSSSVNPGKTYDCILVLTPICSK